MRERQQRHLQGSRLSMASKMNKAMRGVGGKRRRKREERGERGAKREDKEGYRRRAKGRTKRAGSQSSMRAGGRGAQAWAREV